MLEYGAALIADKRRRPTDDMLSIVVGATLSDVEPPTLSDGELYAFFSLLFSAGSETTRNAIAGGLLALIERPDQLADLRRAGPAEFGDRGDAAVDHAVAVEASHRHPPDELAATRWPGEKVLVWEGSANRDESLRPVDGVRHQAGSQPAPVVRARAALLPGRQPGPAGDAGGLRGAAPRFATYELARPPEWTRSNRHTGIRHLFVSLSRG